jgi:excisionase family DNA binding protein
MPEAWLSIEQAAVALGLSVRTVNRHIQANKLPSRLTDGRREVLVNVRRSALTGEFMIPPAPATSAGGAPFADSPLSGAATAQAGSAAPAVAPSAPSVTFQEEPTTPPGPMPYVTANGDGASRTGYQETSGNGARLGAPSAPSATSAAPSSPTPTYDSETVLALADSAAEKAELAVNAYQALARAAVTQYEATRRAARVAWTLVGIMAVGVVVAVGWTANRLTRVQIESQQMQQKVSEAANLADSASAERDRLRDKLTEAREQAARAEGQLTALTDAQRAQLAAQQARDRQQRQSPQPATRPTTIGQWIRNGIGLTDN